MKGKGVSAREKEDRSAMTDSLTYFWPNIPLTWIHTMRWEHLHLLSTIFENVFLSIKHFHTSNVLVVFQFADSVPQASPPPPSPLKHVYTSNVCNVLVFQFAPDRATQACPPSPPPLKHMYTSNVCNVLVFQFEPLCTNRVTQACLPSPPPLRWREKRPGRKEVSQLKSVKRETYRIYRYNYNLSVAWMALVVLTARYQWAFVSLVLQVFRPVW